MHLGMHLLVTGGAGFIGSQFTHMVCDLAESVVVIDALTYAGRGEALLDLPKNVKRVIADIRDPNRVAGVIRRHKQHITHVVHLAAETHVDRSIKDEDPFIKTNIMGTAHVLAAVRELSVPIKKMVYVSTDEVYGSRLLGSSIETDLLNPSSPYSASKAAGEMLCMAEFRTHKTPICITRGTNTYGPGQHEEKFIPTIVRHIMARLPIPIYGDGQQARDWMHVMDHCAGIFSVLTKGEPGEIFNLGANNVISNLDLVHRIAKAVEELGGPKTHRIEYVADRKGHDRRYSVDTRKAEQTIGWGPTIPFDLKGTVHSYMLNAKA